MGDRVLIQLTYGDKFSPVLYCHNSGHRALDIVKATERRMQGRGGDLEYSFARLVQAAMGNGEGNTGFGVWNAERVLTADDSQGDAGVVVVDIQTWKTKRMGGYLERES
jgi:hypothetical protein